MPVIYVMIKIASIENSRKNELYRYPVHPIGVQAGVCLIRG
jgi:hypothetical protein